MSRVPTGCCLNRRNADGGGQWSVVSSELYIHFRMLWRDTRLPEISFWYLAEFNVINFGTVALKSPFVKGGFRGIFKVSQEIPPAPLAQTGFGSLILVHANVAPGRAL